MHHDRDADFAHLGKLLKALFRRALQQCAMVGGYHHDHRGAVVFRVLRAGHRDLGGVMADGDDDGQAPRHMLKRDLGQKAAFLIGDQELFREVGEDADAIAALIDHTVDHTFHALIVDRAVIVERGRGDGPDAGVFGHSVISKLE